MLYEHLVIKTYDVSKLIDYSLLEIFLQELSISTSSQATRFVSPVRQVTRVEGYNALGGTTRCGGDSAAEVSPEAPTKARKVAAAQRPALNLGVWIGGCPGTEVRINGERING